MRLGSIAWGLLSITAFAHGCGPDTLFVNAQLGLDHRCEVRADDAHTIERPVFDIAPGIGQGSDACDDPFVMLLWVDNPNGERVRVTQAEVALETVARQRLQFDDEVPLPNPFLVSASGALPADGAEVVELEVIPRVYAPSLGDFDGDRLTAEITLFGETSSGDEVEGERATFPIEICDGCRTLCGTDPQADEATCSDPALGPQRSFCIDPEC